MKNEINKVTHYDSFSVEKNAHKIQWWTKHD
jgi:hypothetical protein